MTNMNPVNLVNTAKTMLKQAVPSFKGNENAVNNKGLQADKVELSANKNSVETPEAKMTAAVNKILDEQLQLKEGQSVVVKADKTHVPFLKIFAEEAYKNMNL